MKYEKWLSEWIKNFIELMPKDKNQPYLPSKIVEYLLLKKQNLS